MTELWHARSLTNSTLSSNSAPDGGSIYDGGGTLTVTNSLLDGNSGKRGHEHDDEHEDGHEDDH